MGRAVAAHEIAETVLPDAEVSWVEGAAYPMIRLTGGKGARGSLLRCSQSSDLERMNFYETGFSYRLAEVQTANGPAQVYLPPDDIGTPGAPFDIADWVETWGAINTEAATEAMSLFGRIPADQLAERYQSIHPRAASRVRARSAAPNPLAHKGEVQIDSQQLPYCDFFAMTELNLRVPKFDGTLSAPMRRAVFTAMDAAMVLPYDPVRDVVLLVEQARMGPLVRQDPNVWQFEPIAGFVDVGETPEQAAHREAQEEAGIALQELVKISGSYPSPGATSEFYYIFLGLADLPDDVAGVSGLASEGENIRSHILAFETFLDLANSDKLGAGPLVLCAYWLAHHRASLRAE